MTIDDQEQEMGTPAADTPSMYQLLVLVDPVSLAGSNRIGFPFGLNPLRNSR